MTTDDFTNSPYTKHQGNVPVPVIQIGNVLAAAARRGIRVERVNEDNNVTRWKITHLATKKSWIFEIRESDPNKSIII